MREMMPTSKGISAELLKGDTQSRGFAITFVLLFFLLVVLQIRSAMLAQKGAIELSGR